MAPQAIQAQEGGLPTAEGSWPASYAPDPVAHRAPSESLLQSIFLLAKGRAADARSRCAYGPSALTPRQRERAPACIRQKEAGRRWSKSFRELSFALRSVCGSI